MLNPGLLAQGAGAGINVGERRPTDVSMEIRHRIRAPQMQVFSSRATPLAAETTAASWSSRDLSQGPLTTASGGLPGPACSSNTGTLSP